MKENEGTGDMFKHELIIQRLVNKGEVNHK
jgi:hypothetical protein